MLENVGQRLRGDEVRGRLERLRQSLAGDVDHHGETCARHQCVDPGAQPAAHARARPGMDRAIVDCS
jgi:hypothetical protein